MSAFVVPPVRAAWSVLEYIIEHTWSRWTLGALVCAVAGPFLVTITAFAGEAAAAQDPIRLICEFKSPMGQEANQRYLVEIRLDSKSIRSTLFIDGRAGNVKTYEITAENEHSIIGWLKDSSGHLEEGVTVNRITSEAQFRALVYGAGREKIWNFESIRMRGFDYDPVTMLTKGLQCRSATRQF